jgi:hypothetical protein
MHSPTVATAQDGEWHPFGRGWTTASLVALTMLMLILARRYGAGQYGIGAVPFLLLQFVLTGVVAGRAVRSLLKRLWRPLAETAAWAAGAVAAAVALETWNTKPSGDPLLTPLFLVLLVPAALWALVAPPPTRNGARATAVTAAVGYMIARSASL